MTNQTNTNTTSTSNNPMSWVIMHNCAILGVFTRPEWAAAKVVSLLDEELKVRTERAERIKAQKPDGIYVLRDGYDPDTGEIDLLLQPTPEQVLEVIIERSSTLGVTVAGLGSSTYALNIAPIIMDT